jgi:hypothetical protein
MFPEQRPMFPERGPNVQETTRSNMVTETTSKGSVLVGHSLRCKDQPEYSLRNPCMFPERGPNVP